MNVANRVALIIRPKEPYWAWASARDEKAARHVAAVREKRSTVYLVEPLDETALDPVKVVRPHFKEIFDEELLSWHRCEEEWPQKRTFAMFQEWFDVSGIELVFDLSDDAELYAE